MVRIVRPSRPAADARLRVRCGSVRRPGGRSDRHETHVADADEAQRLAQIGGRHVDAAAIHAGDEIAAARQDHDRRPVLEQRQIALRRIEAERQPRLRDDVDPLFQLVGNAKIPHRRRNQHAVGEREAERDALGDRKRIALRIRERPPADAGIFGLQYIALEFRQVIPPQVHHVDVPVRPHLAEAVDKDLRAGGGFRVRARRAAQVKEFGHGRALFIPIP